jgi:hypothetical protein
VIGRSDLGGRVEDWFESGTPVGRTAVVIGCAVAYLAMLAWAWQHTSYDVWGAILIAPLLIAVTWPIARFAAHEESDPSMARLLIIALLVKMMMTLVRYAVAFGVYGGAADAAAYHRVGAELARQFRSGDLDTNGTALTGTGFIRVFTGAVYAVTGPTMIGGFLIYSFLGFCGLYLLYRAYRVAVPDADHRRYAWLIFFLPSLTFWPSSIGKEAWMCLMLGIAAYGAAKALTHRRGGFALVALGIAGGAIVRPHVMLIFFIGLSTAYLLRPGRSQSILGFLPKLLGIAVLIPAGILLVGEVESFFEVDDVTQGGTTEILEIAGDRSDKGGSEYNTVSPTSPGRFLYAAVTVLFRPFPNEAGNFQGLLASAEALVVAGLLIVAIPRWVPVLWNLRRWSYAVIGVIYTLMFCYAFASIGNFGILTRQRVQVLPFLLALACLPRRAPAAERVPPVTTRVPTRA